MYVTTVAFKCSKHLMCWPFADLVLLTVDALGIKVIIFIDITDVLAAMNATSLVTTRVVEFFDMVMAIVVFHIHLESGGHVHVI